MNRHHPYGGGYDHSRRGGPGQGGFGPDRSHRFSDRGGPSRGRGGYRGGRGGTPSYGGYDGSLAYDQGPPQGDMGGYTSYDSGAQDTYYQNGSYNAGMPGQYGSTTDASGAYDQNYGSYEDGSSQGYGQGGYGQRGGFKRGGAPRRERDDKVHDSIIEERIQRERPCRTLFIRNIKYETDSSDVRRLFEEHGEIKTFFDLIANRGMVFVTYYDLRAAERARERLQGSEISGRPIDVHYSLPRDDRNGGDKERSQQLQGTLLVTLKNSTSNQPIDDNEVRRKFQQFGDVKSVRPSGDRTDQRFVEFFDTRAADEAYDRLRHQGLQDGVMEIVLAAEPEGPRGGAGSPRRDDRGAYGGRDWDYKPRGGRGGRGRGRGWGGDSWGDRRDFPRDSHRGGREYDDFGRDARGYDTRFDGRAGAPGPYPAPPAGPVGGPAPYGGAPPPPGSYPPPPAAVPPPDERLEQAKQVQQLLAALKQPQAGGVLPTQPAAPPPAVPSMPPQSAQGAYYPPHMQPSYPAPPSAPSAMPPYPPQPMQQSSSSGSQPGGPAPGTPSLAGLPPNILAMLQQTAQSQSQQSTPPPTTQAPPYNMPPPHVPGVASMPPSSQSYQQLMAYLSQKRPQ
ncbi:unnamed protein product [Somion occarium]|uniref:RRM domain-containing protein n=1 Tax=Somion occarium TaxID=3059160 RepID=A0ABP1CFA0_9APHY